jgi:cytochrome P450
LTTLWFIIARYPDVWAKLQAEIATLNGQQPTFEQLKELKYLQAVMNEVLRLWAPVSMNSRVCLSDRVLPRGGGPDGTSPLFMPAGSSLAWSLYAYHRQKDIWGPDAEEFKPERWLGEDAMRFGWHYTPFNAGPRICLGQQFALSQVGYVTVRLCQVFEGVELRGELREWQENSSLIISHNEGATVSLKPRK